MNMLYVPDKYHISVLYDGQDTCVLGQEWEALSIHNNRRENVEAAAKRNLPIVSTAVDLPDGISMILNVHEAIYDDSKT
jgi:hypothetical protein